MSRSSGLPAEFVREISGLLGPERLLCDEPLAKHTTFQIGGPADFLALPGCADEAARIIGAARRYGVPVTILGNGSNVLVLDGGIRGLVLKFDAAAMGKIRRAGNLVLAGAGAMLRDVSIFAAAASLTGLEFAIGIPGSIGGAVYMNAGAYEGEIGCLVDAVTAVCSDGTIRRFSHDEIGFGYRHSVFQDNGAAICEVEIALQTGNAADIAAKMADLTLRRESKQPLEQPSAGSTFKRPPGHFAGTLIESTGLKGLRFGGAQVSEKHAGFIVNAGGATAADVRALISEVRSRVFEASGVMLHPEVKMIGEEATEE